MGQQERRSEEGGGRKGEKEGEREGGRKREKEEGREGGGREGGGEGEGGRLPHTLYFKASSLNPGELQCCSSEGMDASNLSQLSSQAPNVLIDFLNIWIFSSSPAIFSFK